MVNNSSLTGNEENELNNFNDEDENNDTNKDINLTGQFSNTDGFYNENCRFSFLPYDLDALGYLHLDGNMHLSSPYSIKQVDNTHISMVFTLKEKTHVKFYFEHTTTGELISIHLLKQNTEGKYEFLYKGNYLHGPGGYMTATILDLILDPLIKNPIIQLIFPMNIFIIN